ncbi:MAG: SDR family NAD(P)-dependent oxidoreductase [Nevskia sp.]|nr:SDR family NAD(P)-dependent oxidoreductase [Nevskia sp.]
MTALHDATIWITGASSGIGEALALDAGRRGARLVLSARRESELERVRAACAAPSKVALLPLDLMDFDAADAAARAERRFGPIDVLVNNAGKSQRSLLVDTSMDVYRQLMELDYFAPVALTRALVPSMRARKTGHVVMISSIAGRIGAPLRTGYSAAKHALAGFTEAARAELWRDGLRFTTVFPGYVQTGISANALSGDGSLFGVTDRNIAGGIAAADCAASIWRAVEAGDEEVFMGGKEVAYERLKRYLPGLFSFALKRSNVNR